MNTSLHGARPARSDGREAVVGTSGTDGATESADLDRSVEGEASTIDTAPRKCVPEVG